MRQWRASRRQKSYLIYLLTNTVTGKRYVGATKCTLNERWVRHIEKARAGRPSLLHVGIREFGPEVFERRVLSEALNEEAAYALEKFWIRELQTRDPAGYNMNAGGKGQLGYVTVSR